MVLQRLHMLGAALSAGPFNIREYKTVQEAVHLYVFEVHSASMVIAFGKVWCRSLRAEVSAGLEGRLWARSCVGKAIKLSAFKL